jgi:hypothetical protein
MGAPGSGTKAADQPSAEALLTAFKKIDAAERRRHASVLNYWLSIRGDKEFPPLHDLDPLELSDAGPQSILMELISGGHDAEIRHMGEALRGDDWPERIMDADQPSVLSCIAKKLPIVAISRDFLAFEDEFDAGDGPTRCWVTLLPLSAGGAWVDYVYGLVSLEGPAAKAAKPSKAKKTPDPAPEIAPEVIDDVEETSAAVDEPIAQVSEFEVAAEESEAAVEQVEDVVFESAPEAFDVVDDYEEPSSSRTAKAAPGFSKLLDSIAGLTGFYGSQPVKVEPVIETAEQTPDYPESDEPVAEEPAAEKVAVEEPVAQEPVAEEQTFEPEPESQQEQVAVAEERAQPVTESPTRASEGSLKNKLADVRTKADEARLAKIRANTALYEGLSAAYDFALDAEETPEEYLKLVEAQGLKIQLRSPMKPVVKLAFEGMCDDMTIKQLEAVLAWAFDEELPRGTLAERIDSAGGISQILNEKKAA